MSLTLSQLLKQEEQLQFVYFTSTTAWDLGSYLHQMAYERDLSVAIEVFALEQVLFHSERIGMGKTSRYTLKQMRNHVLESGHSSHFLALNQDGNKRFGSSDRVTNHTSHIIAAQGGGFPIRMGNGKLIGAICCGGLTSIDDHNLVVEALRHIISQQALID
jgi:uncharacterized protein (UPF0303 family)